MMPPKTRQAGAKKVRRKEKKNVAHGHAHIKSTFNNTIVSITDVTGNVISWASSGQVGFKGSCKSTPYAAQMVAEAAARRAQHGMRQGRRLASRVPAPAARPRSASAGRRPRGRSDPGWTPGAAQRLPPAQAASSLRRRRTRHPWLDTPAGLQAVPPREDQAVPQGREVRTPKCPIEIRPYPPGEHGRGRTKDSEYLLQMREKQKCARIYGAEKQFRGYYEEANRRTARPVRTSSDSRDPPRQRHLPLRLREEP